MMINCDLRDGFVDQYLTLMIDSFSCTPLTLQDIKETKHYGQTHNGCGSLYLVNHKSFVDTCYKTLIWYTRKEAV